MEKIENTKKQNSLQGLLRFAVEQSTSGESNQKVCTQLDEEKKKFLNDVLQEMSVDVTKELQNAITVLDKSSSLSTEKLFALNVVRDHIANIDFANTFLKIGGATVLIPMLKTTEDEVRISSLNIVAEMSQNNPFCQNYFVEADLLPLLISYFKENKNVSKAAIFAVSSLIRGFEPGFVCFLQSEGIDSLLSCLDSPNEQIFVKVCFLIGCLAQEYPAFHDKMMLNVCSEKLFKFVRSSTEFDIKLEMILFAVSRIYSSEKFIPKSESISNIVEVLNDIINKHSDFPQCEEILSHARSILLKIQTCKIE